MPGSLRLSKNRVIASQCSHWRGNPPDFQTFSSLNHRFLRSTGGFPHQSADWFGMTTYLSDFFDTLKEPSIARLPVLYGKNLAYTIAAVMIAIL